MYVGTERQRHTNALKRDLKTDRDQQAIIDKELGLIRKYMLDRSLSYGLLQTGQTTNPQAWQIYSTYLKALPRGLVLSEENILDTISYLILFMIENRKDQMIQHLALTTGADRGVRSPATKAAAPKAKKQTTSKKKGARK